MAKRKNDGSSVLTGLAIVGKGMFGVASKITDNFDILGNKKRQRDARIAWLRDKYRDESIVQKLVQCQYWVGQSSEQLRDSLGEPVAVDDKLLKTIKREVWKYNQNGKNRYRLRITVENDRVVGWDHKH